MGLHQACQSGEWNPSNNLMHIVAKVHGIDLARADAPFVVVRGSTQPGDDDTHAIRLLWVGID
eukprot:2549077-Alexandrium_andersonii.AAC.1